MPFNVNISNENLDKLTFRFPFPNMPPPNPNVPPPVRAPSASNATNSIPPSRPLFPSASQVSSATTISSGPVGADFKPISNSKTFEAKPVMNENKGTVYSALEIKFELFRSMIFMS